MAARKVSADLMLAGFGGLSFMTLANFMNLPMSYEQRIWSLETIFWVAIAKIEDDPKFKDDKEISMLISGTRTLLNQVGQDYLSKYEDHKTHNEDENNYRKLVCQTFGKLTQILGKTKMIERQVMEQEPVG